MGWFPEVDSEIAWQIISGWGGGSITCHSARIGANVRFQSEGRPRRLELLTAFEMESLEITFFLSRLNASQNGSSGLRNHLRGASDL